MAKAKKGSKSNPITEKDKAELELPEYVIVSAKLNDGKCDFSFRTQIGVHTGEVATIKGVGIFFETLRDAFNKLNVHLAVIDEAYKHSGIEIDDIDKFHTDDLALSYTVDAFKIKGEGDSETITLIGTKYTSLGSIGIETPKIALDSLSGYKWYNELKSASDEARREVAEYKEGNFEVPEKEEKPNAKQLRISAEGFNSEKDFEEAAV